VVVREKQLATSAGAFAADRRGPMLFSAFAMVAPGKKPEEVEAAIYEEIEKVKTGPIAEWEIEKAHNGARRTQAAQATSSLARAVQLGEYAMFYDNPNLINTRSQQILAVTAADVQRVARKYLTKENRSVVITVPKAAAPQGVKQ
jgi:zinc protease